MEGSGSALIPPKRNAGGGRERPWAQSCLPVQAAASRRQREEFLSPSLQEEPPQRGSVLLPVRATNLDSLPRASLAPATQTSGTRPGKVPATVLRRQQWPIQQASTVHSTPAGGRGRLGWGSRARQGPGPGEWGGAQAATGKETLTPGSGKRRLALRLGACCFTPWCLFARLSLILAVSVGFLEMVSF